MSRDRWLVLAALAGWLVVAVAVAAYQLPLKHDEARFALAARGDAGWLYVSSGTVALARAGLALADAPRLVVLVAGAGIVVAAAWLGRVAFGARTGAYTAAVVAGAQPFALRSAELLSDLPATACAVAGIAIVVRELERERGPSWRLVAAAPAFAGAFYCRYGEAPLIAIVAACALACYPRRLAARPAVVAVTAAVFVALLVPHAVASVRETGSVLGILELSAGVAARSYVGEGLVAYATSNPFSQFGVLGTPLVVAGLSVLVRPPAHRRPAMFLVTIALAQICVLGLQTQAAPRYVYVATILLVTCGIDAVARAAPSRIAALVRRSALRLVALAWLGVAIAAVPVARHRARLRAPLARAGDAIRADAAGRPCAVAGRQTPQLAWTTGCAGVLGLWPPGRLRYVVALPGEPHELGAGAVPIADDVWRLAP